MLDLTQGQKLGPLRGLKPVVEQWHTLMADPDWIVAPWWYNERASLSVLAGAIWLTGGRAFEEFSAEKHSASLRAKPGRRLGRCDIWFRVKWREYVAEVKQCWPNISRGTAGAHTQARESLAQARQEVKRVYEPDATRLAIAFITPQLHKSYETRTSQRLGTLIEQLFSLKQTLVAWTFPRAMRIRPNTGSYTDYIFPGIIILIQVCTG